MNTPREPLEVLSAFIDNEKFDPDDLGRSLAVPGGRELLYDLLAIREIVAVDADGVGSEPRRRLFPRGWLAVAALVLVLVGAFAAGRATAPRGIDETAPAPTRIVELKPGVDWFPTRGGG